MAWASDTVHDDFAPAAMWSYHMVKEGCPHLNYLVFQNPRVFTLLFHFNFFLVSLLVFLFLFLTKSNIKASDCYHKTGCSYFQLKDN